jgi:chromate transporter
MSILIELFLCFFRIGLFSFGGGYAMIPLIQSEIIRHNWLSEAQFADIIAIAEMTPGPIAVNSATYVGYSSAGVWGSLVSTTGVTLPSFLLVLLIARFYSRVQSHPINTMVFYGLRPVVVGLIVSAGLFIGKTALIVSGIDQKWSEWFSQLIKDPFKTIQPIAWVLFVATLIIQHKYKLHPLWIIGGAGAASILLNFLVRIM